MTEPRREWTIDTAMAHVLALRDADDRRYEQRFEAAQQAIALGFTAQKSAVDAALEAQKAAVIKAEAAAERRFEAVNEFRATLSDQQRTLIPRSEVDVMFRSITEKFDLLKDSYERLQAERTGLRGGWGAAVGVVGFVVMVASLIAVWAAR